MEITPWPGLFHSNRSWIDRRNIGGAQFNMVAASGHLYDRAGARKRPVHRRHRICVLGGGRAAFIGALFGRRSDKRDTPAIALGAIIRNGRLSDWRNIAG